MNESNSNNESSQSDDSSTFSDEIIPTHYRIQQFENKFEDINDFWDNTNTTPRHTSVSITNAVNSPHLTAPTKSSKNQFLSYQPTPPRFFQSSMNNAINNSPIYVGTSTEETPRRFDSSESSDSQNEDSSSSSDDITFVDTPIADRSKLQSSTFNRNTDVFKLSPILSNKNELKHEAYDNKSSYSFSSSSENEVMTENHETNISFNNKINDSVTEKIIDNKVENHESPNDFIVDSSFPLPAFSIPDSSDSDKEQQSPEEIVQANDTNISHTKIIKGKKSKINSINNQKRENERGRNVSKPAFASPKKSSNGMKEETIITELSPLVSSGRKIVDSRKEMTVFRLSQIDQEEEEKTENNANILNESDDEKETEIEKVNQHKLPSLKQEAKSKVKSPLHTQSRAQSNTASKVYLRSKIEDNDEDEIESNVQKSKSNLKTKNETESEPKQQKASLSPALKSRYRSKIEDEKEKSPNLQKSNSKSISNSKKENETKNKPKSKKGNVKSVLVEDENEKPKSRSRSKLEDENENESKLQKSKSKTKSKSKSESTSQSPTSKSKSKLSSKAKSSPKTSSKTSPKTSPKSNSQSSKSKPRTRYDFSQLSDDEDDDNRISNLIQLPDSPTNSDKNSDLQNNKDDSDLPIALRRRKRVIVKPLKFWCGEHIVYGLSEDGFRTFQNVAIPEKLRKLKKGEIRVTMKEQKNLPVKEDCVRKLIGVEGKGMAIFQDKVVDFDNSNEVILDKGVKCSVVAKGELPFIFKIDEI